MTKRHFAPVVDQRTRVLILGSLPGEASLRAAQYYAHPQNGFWRLVGGVIGRELAALPYEARLEALTETGVGLWDVVASAERKGSLDTAIRNPEQADLTGFIATLPELRAIAFNGGTAARIGRRILSDTADVTLIDLPSSSPAYTLPASAKADRWAVLSAHLA